VKDFELDGAPHWRERSTQAARGAAHRVGTGITRGVKATGSGVARGTLASGRGIAAVARGVGHVVAWTAGVVAGAVVLAALGTWSATMTAARWLWVAVRAAVLGVGRSVRWAWRLPKRGVDLPPHTRRERALSRAVWRLRIIALTVTVLLIAGGIAHATGIEPGHDHADEHPIQGPVLIPAATKDMDACQKSALTMAQWAAAVDKTFAEHAQAHKDYVQHKREFGDLNNPKPGTVVFIWRQTLKKWGQDESPKLHQWLQATAKDCG